MAVAAVAVAESGGHKNNDVVAMVLATSAPGVLGVLVVLGVLAVLAVDVAVAVVGPGLGLVVRSACRNSSAAWVYAARSITTTSYVQFKY
jgi:hypothetical protein